MKIKHKTVTLLSHEFMHVLGFNHEQNRGDQAQNVRIHWENIDPALHFAFEVMPDWAWMPLGYGYDINSGLFYYRFRPRYNDYL